MNDDDLILDGGGCLEAALAAQDRREDEEAMSRRGVLRGSLLAVLPVWWPKPHPTVKPAYYCDGRIDVDCIAEHGATAGIACLPCVTEPTRVSCTVCGATLIQQGVLSENQCCSGKWVSTFE